MRYIVLFIISFLLIGCATHKNYIKENKTVNYTEDNGYLKLHLDNKNYRIKLPTDYEVKNFGIDSISVQNDNLTITTNHGGGNYFYKSIYNFRKKESSYILVNIICSSYVHDTDKTDDYTYTPKGRIDLEHIDFSEQICQ